MIYQCLGLQIQTVYADEAETQSSLDAVKNTPHGISLMYSVSHKIFSKDHVSIGEKQIKHSSEMRYCSVSF